MKLIGIVGSMDSGKGTVGKILKDSFSYVEESFAKPIKDSVSYVFSWERHLLEGDTKESREFREKIDTWWSQKLGFDVTPRLILQKFGTEAVRNGIHNDVWFLSLERRIGLNPNNYVITDVRFPNEMKWIQSVGGKLLEVRRGDKKPWYDYAWSDNTRGTELMKDYFPTIHSSEWSYIGYDCDYVIDNYGTIDDLYREVNNVLGEINETK